MSEVRLICTPLTDENTDRYSDIGDISLWTGSHDNKTIIDTWNKEKLSLMNSTNSAEYLARQKDIDKKYRIIRLPSLSFSVINASDPYILRMLSLKNCDTVLHVETECKFVPLDSIPSEIDNREPRWYFFTGDKHGNIHTCMPRYSLIKKSMLDDIIVCIKNSKGETQPLSSVHMYCGEMAIFEFSGHEILSQMAERGEIYPDKNIYKIRLWNGLNLREFGVSIHATPENSSDDLTSFALCKVIDVKN